MSAFIPPLLPPRDEEELAMRVQDLSGRTLREVSAALGRKVPQTLARDKGFVGIILEAALGATATSRPEPDFPELGVELKSLPIDPDGRPRETTFVCTVELAELAERTWETSRAKKKLNKVLFVPVEAHPAIDVADRRIGTGFMWTPNAREEQVLRDDWESAATLIRSGFIDALTAENGEVLQLRPKAPNAKARRTLIDDEGEMYETLPRGFYLRRGFTEFLLNNRLQVT
ncbi:MAG: DNA mismatch repair endonuclease MutH [Deltaproteobacteria bacterium]|nr:DNA mismatch repair endonuclease MutH [Deltaproteobacteria bacterium]